MESVPVEHHGAAVDAHAHTARGRHTVLQRGEEVLVQHLGLVVAALPLLRLSSSKRWRWSMGSFSSEKALPISQRQMNSSNRSVSRGSSGLRLASGLTSTGYMVMKVG